MSEEQKDPYLYHPDGSPREIVITRFDGQVITLSLELLEKMSQGKEPITSLTPLTHQTIIKEWVEYIAGPRPQ